MNPLDAEKLLTTNDYSLVLMDIYLTGQLHNRAFELIDHVRKGRPSTQMVLLTAYTSNALSAHVKNDEHISILAKPQPIPYLAELIDGYLRGAPMAVPP